jgi:PAS domain S-box-containing protein
MSRDSILVMDPTGRIVWANHLAHDIVGLSPGALIGMNYLELTPPDTHGDLLKLHQRKLKGETVRFRIDLGEGRVLSTTSGLVRAGDREYLFAVGRWAVGEPDGDEVLVGMLAAGEMLKERKGRVDLNSLLVSVLKEEARSLRGKVTLDPGNPPDVIAQPWPIRTLLRGLLLRASGGPGRATVRSGGTRSNGWIRITLPRRIRADSPELVLCRRIAREQGGRLALRDRTVTLTLPAAD